jgi:hypothetical protein
MFIMEEEDEDESALTSVPEQGKDEEAPEGVPSDTETEGKDEYTELEDEDSDDEMDLEDEIEFVENSEQFVDLDTFSSPMSTPSLEFTGQDQEVPELEQQLENTPTSPSAGQGEQDYALNAPSYESGYEEKGYDQGERKQELRDREMIAGIETTSRMRFTGDSEPKQINIGAFQRQMQEQETGRGHSEEDYIVRARQLKEDESLPFQERKKKRELI